MRALHHVDRTAGQCARDRHFVQILRHLLHGGVGDSRRAAEHHGARQRLLARTAFLPMRIDAGAQFDGGVHAEPPRRFDLAAVVADVLDAGVRVLGDVVRRGEIRRVVPARRRDRHRQAVEAETGLIERVAQHNDLLARRFRLFDNARLDRRRERLHPGWADFVERLAEADPVDVAAAGQAGDQHGMLVFAALRIHRPGEQERLAIRLLDAAAVLPAHQRMHLGVFVHRLIDNDEPARRGEREHVIVQIGVGARQALVVAVAVEDRLVARGRHQVSSEPIRSFRLYVASTQEPRRTVRHRG